VYSGSVCCISGVVSLSSWLFFMVLICGVFQDLFFSFSLVVVFNFSIVLFLLLPFDLNSTQVCSLTSLVFLWYTVTENSFM